MPNQRNCQQLWSELEELKSYRLQMTAAFEHGQKIKDFSACAVLRKKIRDLINTDKTELGKMASEFKEPKLQKRYREFINSLNLTGELKEKLLAVYDDYEEAKATAEEFDPQIKVPKKWKVITQIRALGAEKLERIATIMGKPGLIIEPDKSFVEMKDSMDQHLHYENQEPCMFDLDEFMQRSGRPGKVRVSIMDMVQSPAFIPGQNPGKQQSDEQFRICEKYFRDNGMRLVNDRQYAAGMQQSLRAYEQARNKGEANPEKYILDGSYLPETSTIFDQQLYFTINKMPRGTFSRHRRQILFDAMWANTLETFLRGRGAVQIM